jgi:CPA1 family monovalent cation:H+ antiporter
MQTFPIVLTLLVVVTLLSIAARRVHLPYPTVMVLGGLAISLIPRLPRVETDPELLLVLFLPPLLYAAAWFTSWRDFRANLRPISMLALGFVVFTTVIIAWAAHALIPGMTWPAAFALGAIVSPPDAIAAVAITDRLGVPKRVVTILEGESLVNDATGLLLYRVAVAAAVTGAFSLPVAAGQFVLMAGGGVLVGLALGLVTAQVHKRLEDPLRETVITLLTPYAVYLAAEQVHTSGVLAVVACGLYLSRRSHQLFSSSTRLQANAVWDTVVFLLNGLVFVLIGLQLPVILEGVSGSTLRAAAWYALVISVLVFVVRILWVFPVAYGTPLLIPRVRRAEPAPQWQNVLVVAFTAMRGVVSLAAALALPMVTLSGEPFPQRRLIIFLTFSVILATLVVQSLTLPLLIRALRLRADGGEHCEEWEARVRAADAALAHLREVTQRAPAPHDDVIRTLQDRYLARVSRLAGCQGDDEVAAAMAEEGMSANAVESDGGLRRLLLEALDVERRTIIDLRDRDVISDEVLRRIERDLDLEDIRLQS